MEKRARFMKTYLSQMLERKSLKHLNRNRSNT